MHEMDPSSVYPAVLKISCRSIRFAQAFFFALIIAEDIRFLSRGSVDEGGVGISIVSGFLWWGFDGTDCASMAVYNRFSLSTILALRRTGLEIFKGCKALREGFLLLRSEVTRPEELFASNFRCDLLADALVHLESDVLRL